MWMERKISIDLDESKKWSKKVKEHITVYVERMHHDDVKV